VRFGAGWVGLRWVGRRVEAWETGGGLRCRVRRFVDGVKTAGCGERVEDAEIGWGEGAETERLWVAAADDE